MFQVYSKMIWLYTHTHTHIYTCSFRLVTQLCLTLAWGTAAQQVSLSFIISRSLLKLTSIESMMLSNHLILCHPLFLLPSIFPIVRVFSSESAVRIRWPKYWSFSICPFNEYSELTSLQLTGLISLLSKELSRVLSRTTVWNHQFFGAQPSLWSSSHIYTWLLEKL